MVNTPSIIHLVPVEKELSSCWRAWLSHFYSFCCTWSLLGIFPLRFCDSHPITKSFPCLCCSSSRRASFGQPASSSRGSSKIIFTAIHLFNLASAASGKYQGGICSVVNTFPPRTMCFLLLDVGAVVQCHLDLRAYQGRMSGCAARTALPGERLMVGYPIMANLSKFWV